MKKPKCLDIGPMDKYYYLNRLKYPNTPRNLKPTVWCYIQEGTQMCLRHQMWNKEIIWQKKAKLYSYLSSKAFTALHYFENVLVSRYENIRFTIQLQGCRALTFLEFFKNCKFRRARAAVLKACNGFKIASQTFRFHFHVHKF